jgi:hypothetical protein
MARWILFLNGSERIENNYNTWESKKGEYRKDN